ncbi:hypothetical protein LOAG_16921 [Loa loa]|uniref:Uncharacterized protein n=1 Tax=Loa loa TaxID=7209 RepID=A0A1S0UMJ3_LOALO|nr:hypothetical protein LOAG_16921 [Loa loa]EJD76067.1 hypothetical protein LOAG_16921 [Loa loa]
MKQASTETSRHPKKRVDQPSRKYSTPSDYEILFNADHAVQGSIIQHTAQQPVKSELESDYDGDVHGHTAQKTGKATGIDGIPSEVWKHLQSLLPYTRTSKIELLKLPRYHPAFYCQQNPSKNTSEWIAAHYIRKSSTRKPMWLQSK